MDTKTATGKLLIVAIAATLAQPLAAQETRVERDMRCYEQPESCNGAMGWDGARGVQGSDPIGDAIVGLLILGGLAAIAGAMADDNDQATPATTPAPVTGRDRSDVAPGMIVARVTGIRADDVLNVRSGPGTEYPILIEIPPNGFNVMLDTEECRKMAGYAFAWCPVEYNGVAGWVSSGFLTAQ